MKKKNEKALFIHRLGAFIIDIFLVSCITSLISYPFLDSKSINKLNNSTTELIEKYTNGEINIETYTDEVKSVTYELAKKQGASSLITITLTILYFVVYQYKRQGQTIGKQLLKIKVVSSNDEKLTTNNYVIRSLIINSVLVDLISLTFVIFGDVNTYFYSTAICGLVKYVLLLTCAFMVMWSKSGIGLHDKLAHTMVVKA